jgi:hypothetical protein
VVRPHWPHTNHVTTTSLHPTPHPTLPTNENGRTYFRLANCAAVACCGFSTLGSGPPPPSPPPYLSSPPCVSIPRLLIVPAPPHRRVRWQCRDDGIRVTQQILPESGVSGRRKMVCTRGRRRTQRIVSRSKCHAPSTEVLCVNRTRICRGRKEYKKVVMVAAAILGIVSVLSKRIVRRRCCCPKLAGRRVLLSRSRPSHAHMAATSSALPPRSCNTTVHSHVRD